MTTMYLPMLTAVLALCNLSKGVGGSDPLTSCTKLSKCSCKTNTGETISLAGLKRQKFEGPGGNFQWEPCGEFDIGSLTGVSLVEVDGSTGLFTDLGTMEGTYFEVSNTHLNFFMQSKDKARTSMVTLICSKGDSAFKFKARGVPFYAFELKSPYCCPGGPATGGSSLSIGSILLITFFVVLASYLIFGVIFNSAVRKVEGSARIPHAMFWAAIPGLVVDGFKFALGKICGVKSTVYSDI